MLHAREVLAPNIASLGPAMFPEDANDASTLLQLADAALYRARHAGRNQVAMHGEVSWGCRRPDGAAGMLQCGFLVTGHSA